MGPGALPYRNTARCQARQKKAGPTFPASSLTGAPRAGYPRQSAGVMKWQTCQTQNLVRRKLRVGSSPTAGNNQLAIAVAAPRAKAAGAAQTIMCTSAQNVSG